MLNMLHYRAADLYSFFSLQNLTSVRIKQQYHIASLRQPLVTTILLFVSMNSTTPGASYKWNYINTMFVLLCPAFFT